MSEHRITVENNEDRHRFEAHTGEDTAVLEYTLATNLIVYNHTEVPKHLEGQGIASQMAKVALEYAKEHNLKIMPLCPYVAAYIRRHPEYKSLLRAGFNV